MNFVRQSKFRHVYAKPQKIEFCLKDVRITKISAESHFCDVNQKFIAIIVEGSGGPFMVFPIGKHVLAIQLYPVPGFIPSLRGCKARVLPLNYGGGYHRTKSWNKQGRVEKDHPFVDAHRAPALDVAWCPFNDNVIASCSEDSTAKVWLIPEKGLVKNLTEPIVELVGHQKRVHTVLWHPTAGNVLLTAGGDHKILLWNVGTGEALIELAGHPENIWSVAFNYNGSKIVTTCKDRKIRVIDPRSGAIIQQGQGHEGVKPQQAIFMRDGRIFSTGFTKRSERMYALREETALDEPIVQEELDTSNGVLYPLYDADTGLLFLCGKGDCAIRFYEVNDDPPFVHYIDTHTAQEPQRGIGFMPKLGLNISENEISRVYKCTNKGVVEVLQFYVPRKSELFQDDLYPDTAGQKPAITADEWMSGKDADPVLVPVNPTQANTDAAPRATVTKKANILMDMMASGQQDDGGQAPSQPKAPVQRTMATLQEPAPKAAAAAAPKKTESKIKDDVAMASGFIVLTDEPPSAAQMAQLENQRLAEERIQRAKDAAEATRPSVSALAAKASAGASSAETQDRWASRLERIDGGSSSSTSATTRETNGTTTASTHQYEPHASPIKPVSSRNRDYDASSRRESDATSTAGAGGSFEELMSDVHKLKLIVRKHERRIRYLEEQLAEQGSKELDGL